MIFVALQIQEKCQEQNKDLYIAFIDLTSLTPSNVKLSGKFCPYLDALPLYHNPKTSPRQDDSNCPHQRD